MIKEARINIWENTVSSINDLELLHAKSKTGPLSHGMYKIKFKMDYRLKRKTYNHKTPTRKHKPSLISYFSKILYYHGFKYSFL